MQTLLNNEKEVLDIKCYCFRQLNFCTNNLSHQLIMMHDWVNFFFFFFFFFSGTCMFSYQMWIKPEVEDSHAHNYIATFLAIIISHSAKLFIL